MVGYFLELVSEKFEKFLTIDYSEYSTIFSKLLLLSSSCCITPPNALGSAFLFGIYAFLTFFSYTSSLINYNVIYFPWFCAINSYTILFESTLVPPMIAINLSYSLAFKNPFRLKRSMIDDTLCFFVTWS